MCIIMQDSYVYCTEVLFESELRTRIVFKFLNLIKNAHLQIYLQALVIDFSLKGNKVELLCYNQRGLQKGDIYF